MIRRGFWLLTGAVLGVTGYRKATRLARTLTVPQAMGPRTIGPRTADGPTAVARVGSAARFVRDVRVGMAEYRDLRRAEQDRMPGSRTLESRGDSRGQRTDARGSRSGATAPGAGQQGHREP